FQQRFLSLPEAQAGIAPTPASIAGTSALAPNPDFLPGGRFASEGNCTDALGVRGCHRGRFKNRDVWAWNIGIDHNQWIPWLNSSNTFVFTGQLFMNHVLNNRRNYDPGVPASLTNDYFGTGLPYRPMAPLGPNKSPESLARRAAQGLGLGTQAP